MKFTNSEVRCIFDNDKYANFSQLMIDAAKNEVKQYTKAEANDKIREVMFKVLGVEEGCSRKELRRAIRRHRQDVFEVIEETVQNLLVSGWGENPFFNEFVEMKSMALGDTNEFYVPDEVILTVSELSGNHHDIIRQRLGAGKTFPVKTSWYGVKIYTEYEAFMSGRVDWAGFIQKIYEAFDKKINDMVYASLMAAGDKLPNNAQFNKTSPLSAETKDTLITLIEDVQAATGNDVVIMGTKSALSKLTALSDVAWISNEMKEERHTTGRLGLWEGTRLVEIPQRFAPNDTTTRLVDNSKLLIMPVADNKFIKIYDEGDAVITENTDHAVNMDMTLDYEYQQKMGVATVIGKYFGVWTIEQ